MNADSTRLGATRTECGVGREDAGGGTTLATLAMAPRWPVRHPSQRFTGAALPSGVLGEARTCSVSGRGSQSLGVLRPHRARNTAEPMAMPSPTRNQTTRTDRFHQMATSSSSTSSCRAQSRVNRGWTGSIRLAVATNRCHHGGNPVSSVTAMPRRPIPIARIASFSIAARQVDARASGPQTGRASRRLRVTGARHGQEPSNHFSPPQQASAHDHFLRR